MEFWVFDLHNDPNTYIDNKKRRKIIGNNILFFSHNILSYLYHIFLEKQFIHK